MPENLLNLFCTPFQWCLCLICLGSLSFAVIVSKFMGLSDPRSYGSKNPGATNVLRSGNKKAAVLTLLFDAVKGWVPVVWVLQHGSAYGLTEGVAAAAGLAAFLGHLYPIFFKLKGGKGVATALGVLVGVSPCAGLGHCTHLAWRRLVLQILFFGCAVGRRIGTCLLRFGRRRVLVAFQWRHLWHAVCHGHFVGLAPP
jgi:acyl-phosphate glycerol 3-phosphate acyltransferase